MVVNRKVKNYTYSRGVYWSSTSVLPRGWRSNLKTQIRNLGRKALDREKTNQPIHTIVLQQCRRLYGSKIYFSIIMHVTASCVPTYTYNQASINTHVSNTCGDTCAHVCALEIYSMRRVRTFQSFPSIYRLQSGCRPGRISPFIGKACESLILEKIFTRYFMQPISTSITAYYICRVASTIHCAIISPRTCQRVHKWHNPWILGSWTCDHRWNSLYSVS